MAMWQWKMFMVSGAMFVSNCSYSTIKYALDDAILRAIEKNVTVASIEIYQD